MPFKIIPSEEISHRADFAILANARGYVHAVEVGTEQGIFARDFLSRWEGQWLACVDDYRPFTEIALGRVPDMVAASLALAPYLGRYRQIVSKSPHAIDVLKGSIPTFRPQFVYIDADHEYEAVAADIASWWEYLADGGILGGHDFDEEHPGVSQAVEDFARERGLVVRLTHEHLCTSWYCYKGEPATLIQKFFKSGEMANPHAPA